MAFQRPRPPNRTIHTIATNRELELEQINQILRDELSTEISHNKANEKWISRLERDLINCEKEISRKDIAIVASNEEIKELQTEILSLKKDLYQTRKEVRDNNNYTADIENKLQECYEIISSLKQRIKVISSRGNSPVRNNSPDIYSSPEDPDMAYIDPFINVFKGLERLENHLRGNGTPLNNPTNIIQGIHGSLNTIQANYQRIDRDLDNITRQRDDRDNQITRLQQDINGYRQLDTNQQNQINQLTQERDYWEGAWRQANNAGVYCKSSYLYWKATCYQRDRRIGQLLREKFALQLLNKRSNQELERQLQQCRLIKDY